MPAFFPRDFGNPPATPLNRSGPVAGQQKGMEVLAASFKEQAAQIQKGGRTA
jgi:hypothetical protein